MLLLFTNNRDPMKIQESPGTFKVLMDCIVDVIALPGYSSNMPHLYRTIGNAAELLQKPVELKGSGVAQVGAQEEVQ